MHFLLAGRVRWRYLLRPAFVSGLFWLGFALFSSWPDPLDSVRLV